MSRYLSKTQSKYMLRAGQNSEPVVNYDYVIWCKSTFERLFCGLYVKKSRNWVCWFVTRLFKFGFSILRHLINYAWSKWNQEQQNSKIDYIKIIASALENPVANFRLKRSFLPGDISASVLKSTFWEKGN